jgi:DNA repair protein RadD
VQLRGYQRRAVDAIYGYFNSGGAGNPIVALPTASGKSVVQATFCREACELFPDNSRIVCLTHVRELILQNFEKMRAVWPQAPAGIYSASVGRRDAHAKILFAGIQTVYNKAAQLGWIDLIIIDEAHLLPPSGEGQYQRFIADVRKYNPAVKIIGLTATPYRNGQGLLTDGETAIFTDIILDLTQGEELVALIDAGYLAPLHPKRTDTSIDLTGVHTTGGDFNNGALQTACNKEEITDAAIDESLRVATGRASFLWFCAGVDHATAVRDALRNRGEPCEMVSGATPMGERDRILDDFKAHRLKHVTNANVLTTGFDHPSLDVIILLRPTKSASLHVQMLGRGMRISMGKLDCLVLDFAGNTKRLGPINDIRIPKKKGAGGGVAPTKDCPTCKEILPTSVRECPSCGHEFPPPEPEITHSAATDKLIVRKEDKIRDYTVDDVRYSEHTPPGKKPSMKVSYECGFRTFHEWLHVGQPGFLGAKAANWWMKRSPKFCPPTLAEALAQADAELSKPLRIRVNENGKYPEIIASFWSDESATD